MNRRLKYISYIVLASMLFTGCYKNTSNNDQNSDKSTDRIDVTIDENTGATEENSSGVVEEAYTEFNALGNTYFGNKGYEGFNVNDEIVNSSNYVKNEYKNCKKAKNPSNKYSLSGIDVI